MRPEPGVWLSQVFVNSSRSKILVLVTKVALIFPYWIDLYQPFQDPKPTSALILSQPGVRMWQKR